jgi:Zn-finger nucleic acid-binding protein
MSALSCPACKSPLKHYVDQEEHAGAYACGRCSGLWFDGHTLHAFLHSRRMRARFLLKDAEPLSSVGFTINTHPRICPHCHSTLEEDVYGGVEVDVCRTCQGIWFDDGSLERALEVHAKHKARLDLLDAELVADTPPPLPGPFTPDEATVQKMHELAERLPAKVKHVFDAVAHLLHHDHDK